MELPKLNLLFVITMKSERERLKANKTQERAEPTGIY